jgi:hypothetical protein
MKSLFLSYCTEYEAGWGSKPDGFILADNLEACEAEIKRVEDIGSHEMYWRYSKPEEVFCEDETYAKYESLKPEGNQYVGFNSNKSIKDFVLYRRI